MAGAGGGWGAGGDAPVIRDRNPCPTCHRQHSSVYVCDTCKAEMAHAPITVRSDIDGEMDEEHYCSLACLRKERVFTAGVPAWQHLTFTIDGTSAVEALVAMGVGVDK